MEQFGKRPKVIYLVWSCVKILRLREGHINIFE